MTTSAAPDLLATIVAAARRSVEVKSAREPLGALRVRAADTPVRRGIFRSALERPGRPNVIAECKRRSPARGVLRADYDPPELARGYARGGAAAISVLTDSPFFDGSLEHLTAVRGAVDLPILRKDFIVGEYQLLETRAAGGDAVLLIAAALTDDELTTLHRQARVLGLDVLVEAHDAADLTRAIAAGAQIVGINNRNLRTLEVDLGACRALAGLIPADIVAVAESGLTSADEIRALCEMGYRGFLIGERLLTSPDPGRALGMLLAHDDPASAEAAR